MSDSTLFTCLVEEQSDDAAFVQVYWSRAEHLGAAIDNMLAAARANGLENPEPRQVDPFNIDHLQSAVEPSEHSPTFWATGRVFFDPEPLFSLPCGIIGSCIEGDHDIDEIAPGFTREKGLDGKTTIEANVGRKHLLEVYSLLLRLSDSYRVFWYLLHDHWEGGGDHFLVNESLDTPGAILAHLEENQGNSILNGHVTLTAYREEGGTNLNLSDHKRIVIHTFSDDVADSCASALDQAGYPEMDELISVERGIHHWHYRPTRSHSREALIKHLRSNGFKDWTPRK